MRILVVVDKKGRVQYNRAKLFQNLIKNHNIDIVIRGKKNILWDKYDLVYYSHFSLMKKNPCPKKQIAITSITSHKCLIDFKVTLKQLKSFNRVSVNNTILLSRFKGKIDNLYYTPNGVDTSFFVPGNNINHKKIVLGWVGNIDRATKKYHEVIIPLMERVLFCEFKIVGTHKNDDPNKLLDMEQMRDFYQSIDFFLVSSETEGTPNPALEAMSCGVPVITTSVGNMIEIVKDGINGFFVDGDIASFEMMLEEIKEDIMSTVDYDDMRIAARNSMKDWDWSIKYLCWNDFLLGNKTGSS